MLKSKVAQNVIKVGQKVLIVVFLPKSDFFEKWELILMVDFSQVGPGIYLNVK